MAIVDYFKDGPSYEAYLNGKFGWQPIDTAPKDGTYILLYYPAWPSTLWIGHYWITETFIHGKSNGRHEKWYATGMAMSGSKSDPEPTHWQPLPEPPLVPSTHK